jgi:hypothetical protein
MYDRYVAAEIRAWRAVCNDLPATHSANQWYIQHLGKAVQPAKTRTLVRPITLVCMSHRSVCVLCYY